MKKRREREREESIDLVKLRARDGNLQFKLFLEVSKKRLVELG